MENPSNRDRGPWHPPTLPRKKKKKVPIWSVVPKVQNILRPFQDSIVRVGTHWIKEAQRTILCRGPEQGCPLCQESPCWRWTGYLLCRLERIRWREDDREQIQSGAVILHITEHAIESCPRLADPEVCLTEFDVLADRVGKTKRAPVIMNLRYALTPPIVKSTFDLLSYLIELYEAPNNDQRRKQKGGDNS